MQHFHKLRIQSMLSNNMFCQISNSRIHKIFTSCVSFNSSMWESRPWRAESLQRHCWRTHHNPVLLDCTCFKQEVPLLGHMSKNSLWNHRWGSREQQIWNHTREQRSLWCDHHTADLVGLRTLQLRRGTTTTNKSMSGVRDHSYRWWVSNGSHEDVRACFWRLEESVYSQQSHRFWQKYD